MTCDTLQGVVTWALVVVGWAVVHYLSVIRERQRDIRELKDQLIERVLKVEREAVEFHQAPGHDLLRANLLMADLGRISSTLFRAPLAKLHIQPNVIVAFRQSITYKNFDPSRFEAQQVGSRIVATISLAADELACTLEEQHARRYLASWWQVFRL